jgi:hypothetical protein
MVRGHAAVVALGPVVDFLELEPAARFEVTIGGFVISRGLGGEGRGKTYS